MNKLIYLAGGCFWGMEHLMQSIPGVVDAQCGYANGHEGAEASYSAVCSGRTGFRETVRVEYDADKISLEKLLFIFFAVIDPTVFERQGFDIGSQYQTGVYYTDAESKEIIERIAALEKAEYGRRFYVEIEPLRNYFPAEEYHQDYLVKNPSGYCHINPAKIRLLSSIEFEASEYTKSASLLLREKQAHCQPAAFVV